MIQLNLPASDYFAAPEISISTLKHMRPTPAHFKHWLAQPKPEPSSEQIIGTLIHSRILEPGKGPKIAVKTDDIDYRTKAGKAWREQQQVEGNIVLTVDELDEVMACVKSVADSPEVRDLLREGDAEVSVFRDGKKARVDFVPRWDPVLVDIKTVRDASPDGFARSVIDYGWHRQAAWYLDIWNDDQPERHKDGFLWIALEKPTGLLACYVASEAMVQRGREDNAADWALYQECKATNNWPGYDRQVRALDLPKWMK